MQINKKTKSQLLSLKGIIKGLAEEGRRCRKFINSSVKDKRAKHWTIKRSIGEEARYYLIAYGLLRGLDYKQIEPNANKDNLRNFNYSYLSQICTWHCHYLDRGIWTPSNLKLLMLTGSMAAPAIIKKVG